MKRKKIGDVGRHSKYSTVPIKSQAPPRCRCVQTAASRSSVSSISLIAASAYASSSVAATAACASSIIPTASSSRWRSTRLAASAASACSSSSSSSVSSVLDRLYIGMRRVLITHRRIGRAVLARFRACWSSSWVVGKPGGFGTSTRGQEVTRWERVSSPVGQLHWGSPRGS